jgi:hypothetical protein
MKTISQLVSEQKENNEETEFYPTTQEMVNAIVDKIYESFPLYKSCKRLLDIGCGNGCFFEKIDNTHKLSDYIEKFGIEKSSILLNNLPSTVTLLGTDFNEQTLIDKEMDLIFCNPPYSVYEEWATRIIREGNSTAIVLIIPERWKNSQSINQALKARHLEAECIGNYNFLDAERRARAKVDILYIDMSNRHNKVDAFDLWFDNDFKISAVKNSTTDYQFEKSKENIISQELISSGNIAEQLVSFYQKDMENLFNNYKALEKLDYDLLQVLNVDIANLKKSLKEKIKGLKYIYWKQLFDRYNEITSRLTSYSKDKFLNKLYKNAEIDFTIGNIYAVTLWIIKNSNIMFDDQLKDYYLNLASSESIQMYKSNKRFTSDEWKYLKDNAERFVYFYKNKPDKMGKNFCYDYRIIYKKCYHNWEDNNLSSNTFDFVWDTINIAKNLGFKFDNPFEKNRWYTKEISEINILYEDKIPFVNMKLYQNGNIHLKFDIKFMQKLNVESARLFGWINSKEEASEDLGISVQDAAIAWNSNTQILAQSTVNMIEWKK